MKLFWHPYKSSVGPCWHYMTNKKVFGCAILIGDKWVAMEDVIPLESKSTLEEAKAYVEGYFRCKFAAK